SHFESMLPEKPERIVGSLSHATMNPYLALVREFSQSIPQLVQRQVHRSFDATALMLCRLTDINNQGICRRQLCPRRQGSIATHHIACDHASYIDGIFGGAVLRRVAEFALFEIEHSAMLLNRHRNHVDASLDTFLSHSLRPQHSSVRVSINDLQGDRLGARIVSGMVSGVEIDCPKIRVAGSPVQPRAGKPIPPLRNRAPRQRPRPPRYEGRRCAWIRPRGCHLLGLFRARRILQDWSRASRRWQGLQNRQKTPCRTW